MKVRRGRRETACDVFVCGTVIQAFQLFDVSDNATHCPRYKVVLQAFLYTHFLLTLLLPAKVAVRTEGGSLVHLLAVQWRLTPINDPSLMINKQLYDLLCESTRQLYYTRA